MSLIPTIVIEINGREQTLTLVQAQALREALNDLLGPPETPMVYPWLPSWTPTTAGHAAAPRSRRDTPPQEDE